jgi:hypothetical protein
MNLKISDMMFEQVNLLEWSQDFAQIMMLVEREDTMLELSPESVVGVFNEMNENMQRKMASFLQFPFVQRKTKKWSEIMFIKTLNSFLQQAKQDLDRKRKLVLALLHTVSPLLKMDEAILFENEKEWTATYGFWHYYWAVYFSSGRETDPERWRAHLHAIVKQAPTGKSFPEVALPVKELTNTRREVQLEEMLRKEKELRIKLEKDVSQLHKALREKEQKELRLEGRLAAQQLQMEQWEQERKNHAQLVQAEQQKRQEDQARWLANKETFQQKIRGQKQEIEALQREVDQLIEEQVRTRKITAAMQQALQDPDKLIIRLSELLQIGLAHLARKLSDVANEGMDRKSVRSDIRSTLNLLDALDAYSHPVSEALPSMKANDWPPEIPPLSHESQSLTSGNAEPLIHTGTFYRREHGGYIRLDHGEVFNITESMVNKLELQHEAEVECRPKTVNGAVRYEVELLFQGDDSCSPIRQYNGYVQLGEHHTYYCIDVNDPEHRYPLHRKDLEMQQPIDGTPCTFNVSEESEYARLSRTYKDFLPAAKQQLAKETSNLPVDPSKIQKSLSSEKPASFLSGCTIAIVGGQRKWFEDVVLETGAELIHENGDRPERLASTLRRANALFLLLTSTSHQATWDGVGLAKTLGIPHYVIQGSKSNLRKLLWENRQQINNVPK